MQLYWDFVSARSIALALGYHGRPIPEGDEDIWYEISSGTPIAPPSHWARVEVPE